MKIYSNGIPIQVLGKQGFRGMAGPDGNPIGTIISFMGVKPPKDYLICDGAFYKMADYPDLATFFKEQFGSESHFGENGEGTFAVPDMRNLFLRGYHGEGNEQLSGNLGERQEATAHPWIMLSDDALRYGFEFENGQNQVPKNYDTVVQNAVGSRVIKSILSTSTDFNEYTSRPVNMAVLYCIKAVKEEPYEDIYSEEETIIGRWIDGKPLYRITIVTTTGSTNQWKPIYTMEDLDTYVFAYGSFDRGDNSMGTLQEDRVRIRARNNGNIELNASDSSFANKKCIVILLYTKSTD